jgi:hypothetical protein
MLLMPLLQLLLGLPQQLRCQLRVLLFCITANPTTDTTTSSSTWCGATADCCFAALIGKVPGGCERIRAGGWAGL